MDKELQKFKHVLEYFVAHQNYLQSSESSNIQGYVQYIKPLIDSQSFYKTGQGYNDNSIQRQISQWEDIYPGHTLCINIQPNYGNYTSKKCYLNWSGTGINIFCKWGDDEVTGLSIGYAYWWKKPIEYKIIQTRSIKDLNLYNSTSDNDLLKGFYQSFINEIRDYDNRQGEYFLREKDVEMMEKYGYFVDLLRSNHNLILTGAPGTGKTYLAKQIAEQMILGKEYDKETASDEEKEKMKEQYDFVQFHPSFDYTDFVEGLRPFENNGVISFRREDGIFMKFCRKALDAYNEAEKKEEAPKYVFVIDEINRGDLSKIFGELFFCLDPGYRGEKGKVKTQYSNLWKTEKYGDSDFFFIPQNVYIIGTMNDIDRSVESMDFAMRRRFAFKEIPVEDRMEMIKENEKLGSEDIYKEITARMTNLNLAILTIQALSAAYQIGAAYFLKLENYLTSDEKIDVNSWDSLWNNHLHGLLFEYLRGLPNADEDMETLQRAYNLDDKYKIENKKVIKESSQNA